MSLLQGAFSTITRWPRLQHFLQRAGMHHVANAWLRRFPVCRTLPGSGVRYRATRLESLPLATEMLESDTLYDARLLPANIRNFADLGCNVGYFTCWLAHQMPGQPLQGLMVDANPAAVEEARWHAAVNGLAQVHALHGILGERHPGGHADFYLYDSNICSMSQPPPAGFLQLHGRWKKISVPCLQLETEWRRRFGDARCHLLKVDIEGSEMNFLKIEIGFLVLVDTLLIEWHKWRAQLPALCKELQAQGFDLVKVLDESPQMGTAFFKRRQSQN